MELDKKECDILIKVIARMAEICYWRQDVDYPDLSANDIKSILKKLLKEADVPGLTIDGMDSEDTCCCDCGRRLPDDSL